MSAGAETAIGVIFGTGVCVVCAAFGRVAVGCVVCAAIGRRVGIVRRVTCPRVGIVVGGFVVSGVGTGVVGSVGTEYVEPVEIVVARTTSTTCHL